MAQVRIRRSTQQGSPTGYIVTGPSEGECSVESEFTVSLIPPLATTTVTPHDSTGTGTFDPVSVTLTPASSSQVIGYTPDDYGTCSLIFTNNRGLPSQTIAFFSKVQAGKTINAADGDLRYTDIRSCPNHGGYLFFGAYDAAKPLSIINKNIASDAVDPLSATILANWAAWPSVIMYFDVGYTEYLHYGFPLNVVRSTVPLVPLNRVSYAITEGDPGPFRIDPMATALSALEIPVYKLPMGVGYSDQQVLVLSPDEHKLYEMFQAYTNDGGLTWTASGTAEWDGSTGGVRPDEWSSADGAGMPIYPLLLRYDEVARGEIKHALRFTIGNTIGGTNRYVWPARHGAGYFSATGLPWGARVRLKEARYAEVLAAWSGLSGAYVEHARVILTALHEYGMYMCDMGGHWQVTSTTDEQWLPQTFYLFNVGSGQPGAVNLRPSQDFEVLTLQRPCTFTGPATGQVGVPCGPFTVAHNPIDDVDYGAAVYIYEGATYITAVSLSPGSPSGQFNWTPLSSGVKTLTATSPTNWMMPEPLTVTVT